jgi:hypothetical protein
MRERRENMKSSIKVVCAAITLAAAAVSSAQQIQVQVDGQRVAFAYTQPQYVNGRVLVPLRGVFEQMGATVNWDPTTRMVNAHRAGSDVQLRIGDRLAFVNGTSMNLDVPAMIIGGTTMVPIRFLSEALGAQVGWMEAQHLVSINTLSGNGVAILPNQGNYNQTIQNPPQRLRRVVARKDEVIPVILDHTLSTMDNAKGDTFTATVKMSGRDAYGDIPEGTKVEGHVAAIHPKRNDEPALLDLAFDRLIFPNGRTVRIDGTLTSLDNAHVTQDANGVLVVRNTGSSSSADQRMVYAGYGAGAGLLVGILEKKPLEGALLGGVLGYIFGQVKNDQRSKTTSDVTLQPGTEMGVRINRDIAVSW